MPAEAAQAVWQRVIPKLEYAPKTTLLDKTQCHSYNTALRETFVAPMGLNRNYPATVLYAPTEYGGMEFPNIEYLQNQPQLEYWLKQLSWDKTVSNDFKVTLARVQLWSGFVNPILYKTKLPIAYIKESYMLDLRKRMEKIGNTNLCIIEAWTPKLQQVNDALIIERIVRLKGVTKVQLRQVNVVRLWMRVVTILDMTNKAGTDIIGNMMCGEWRTGTD